MLKTAKVIFTESKHDYSTSVNGKLSDQQIKDYFINTVFDVGMYPVENMQKCIDCKVS